MFTCSKCNGSNFYEESTGRKFCSDCHKVRMRAYYQTPAYKERNRKRGRHSADIRDTVRVAQNNRCAICLDEFVSEPHMDHDHITNKLRGLLCSKCNLGLGHFKDDPAILLRAIVYLDRAKSF